MRLVFVRHGEPDYEHDCLTETGKKQAEEVVDRLVGLGITDICASPMGRAQQTAAPTAARLGLPVRTLDFMHEIYWGGPDIPENGHPWALSDRMVLEEDFDFFKYDWREHPFFAQNTATRYFEMISDQLDGFFLEYGYRREGTRYFCESGSDKTIALFSHGGSSNCALAHILSLPLPYVASYFSYDFASVIILDIPVRPGEFVRPCLTFFDGELKSERLRYN